MVNGQIRRDPSNAGGTLLYSQSGGAVQVNGQNSNATNAKLEILNAGSAFTMSNGTLTIVRVLVELLHLLLRLVICT